MTPDMINGLFELFGGTLLLLNIIQLHKDKTVKGVSWLPTMFFTAWGIWNLFFYPYLNQWYSFIGSLWIVITNGIWLIQILYYKHKGA